MLLSKDYKLAQLASTALVQWRMESQKIKDQRISSRPNNYGIELTVGSSKSSSYAPSSTGGGPLWLGGRPAEVDSEATGAVMACSAAAGGACTTSKSNSSSEKSDDESDRGIRRLVKCEGPFVGSFKLRVDDELWYSYTATQQVNRLTYITAVPGTQQR